MMFSTRSEYGVRVMIQLARRRGSGPVPLTGIAEAEALPLAYLEQLVSRLRKADLVSSTRGAHGGYELSRDPAEITMAEVVQALEGSLIPMQCFDELGGTPRAVQPRRRRLRELRHEGAVDPRPGRHRAGARADDARRAGTVRRARRRAAGRRRATPARRRSGTAAHAPTATNRKAINGRPRDSEPARERRGQGDPERGRPRGVPRRGARADGPERLRQVDAREHDPRPPELRDHRGQDPLPGRGRDRGRARRARPRRPLHGVPVPVRDPGRVGRELPAHGDQRAPQGARRGPDQPEGVPQDARGSTWRCWAWTASSPGAT